MRRSRDVEDLVILHVKAHHEGAVRVGRTRERFCQNVAAVLGRFDPPVVELTCRHVLPRVVVVDLDVLRASQVSRVVDDGLRNP